MGIAKFYNEAKADFYIFGLLNKEWKPFVRDTNYMRKKEDTIRNPVVKINKEPDKYNDVVLFRKGS